MTEKELFLTSILKCRRVDLYAQKTPLTQDEEDKLAEMLERRKDGEPVQYIVGTTEFMGSELIVDRKVLIPRPETEILVQTVIDHANKNTLGATHILEIGAGSGNIAISLVKMLSRIAMVSIDVSRNALDVARKNAQHHQVDDLIDFINADIKKPWDNFLDTGQMFDIIVSNPPYIRTSELSGLPLEVQEEPAIALDGGEDGLDFYRAIAKESPEYFKKGGYLFLEIGDGQDKDVASILAAHNKFSVKDPIHDLTGKARVIAAERIDG